MTYSELLVAPFTSFHMPLDPCVFRRERLRASAEAMGRAGLNCLLTIYGIRLTEHEENVEKSCYIINNVLSLRCSLSGSSTLFSAAVASL